MTAEGDASDCDVLLMSGGWTPTGVRTEAHGIDATSHAHSIADALAAGHQAGRTAALAVRTLRAAHAGT